MINWKFDFWTHDLKNSKAWYDLDFLKFYHEIWSPEQNSAQMYEFNIFSWKYVKKASQSQNFRILESLVDFIFIFKVYKFGLKTFKKALSQKNLSGERAFFKSKIEFKINGWL